MNIVWKIKNINRADKNIGVVIATSDSTFSWVVLPPSHSCLSYLNKMTPTLITEHKKNNIEISQFNNLGLNIPYGSVLDDIKH